MRNVNDAMIDKYRFDIDPLVWTKDIDMRFRHATTHAMALYLKGRNP